MGRPTEVKHREALYQQLCAQIAREAQDHKTLAAAGARALASHDVHDDPTLAGMLRSFIAAREAEIRVEAAERFGGSLDDSQLRKAFVDRAEQAAPHDLAETVVELERARLELEAHAIHFDEPGARRALARVSDLSQRYPQLINPATRERCEQRLARLQRQCEEFRTQVEGLADQAVAAARRGDGAKAGWAVRRLSAIHALRPTLLPDERYEEIRARIEGNGQRLEDQDWACELIAKERAVAAEVRDLAVIIRKFQHIASRLLPSEPAYRQVESEYRRAVRALQEHDDDWLSGLSIELHALVEEMHDGSGQAAHQADHFFAAVRDSLRRLRAEIGAIA